MHGADANIFQIFSEVIQCSLLKREQSQDDALCDIYISVKES